MYSFLSFPATQHTHGDISACSFFPQPIQVFPQLKLILPPRLNRYTDVRRKQPLQYRFLRTLDSFGFPNLIDRWKQYNLSIIVNDNPGNTLPSHFFSIVLLVDKRIFLQNFCDVFHCLVTQDSQSNSQNGKKGCCRRHRQPSEGSNSTPPHSVRWSPFSMCVEKFFEAGLSRFCLCFDCVFLVLVGVSGSDRPPLNALVNIAKSPLTIANVPVGAPFNMESPIRFERGSEEGDHFHPSQRCLRFSLATSPFCLDISEVSGARKVFEGYLRQIDELIARSLTLFFVKSDKVLYSLSLPESP